MDAQRQSSAGLRPPCPECGADDALVLRGKQRHHPPRWLRWLTMIMRRTVAELSPLTRSADLLRSLTTGTLGPSIAIDMLYLLAMAGLGLTVASRRLRCQLLR